MATEKTKKTKTPTGKTTKKAESKSKSNLSKPVWLKYTEKEVKDIILSIAKKSPELGSEKIGLILRDNYGIPKTKIYGFKIGKILKEEGIYQGSDMKNLTKKEEKLQEHIKKNQQDKKSKRSLTITKAKIKKTKEYLQSKNN